MLSNRKPKLETKPQLKHTPTESEFYLNKYKESLKRLESNKLMVNEIKGLVSLWASRTLKLRNTKNIQRSSIPNIITVMARYYGWRKINNKEKQNALNLSRFINKLKLLSLREETSSEKYKSEKLIAYLRKVESK